MPNSWPNFSPKFFGENIKKILTSAPEREERSLEQNAWMVERNLTMEDPEAAEFWKYR
jgi:hypothetical protein